MSETGICAQCGAELPEGNCPACLLKLGLSGAIPVAAPMALPPVRKSKFWIWAVIGGVILALALALFFRAPRQPEQGSVRLSLLPPDQTTIAALAISPDGRSLAFIGVSRNGETRLWVRRLDSMEPRVITGSEGAAFPFWSPDSQHLAFFAGGQLTRIPVEGGYLQKICAAPNGRGGAWNGDGTIVFAPSGSGVLSRVDAAGGDPRAVTKAAASSSHRWPAFLPDERHFLYTVRNARPEDSGIYVGSLDSGDRKRLLGDLSNAVYAEGHLLFFRGGMLMAQGYDAARHRLIGEPFTLSEQVGYSAGQMYTSFSAAGGLLVFDSWGRPAEDQLAWFDRSGRRLATIGVPGFHSRPRLSPDDRELLAVYEDHMGRSDLWLHDLRREVASRFTLDQRSRNGVWSPDGKRIAFASNRPDGTAIYERASNGGGSDRLLVEAGAAAHPTSWSPDGRYLLYQVMGSKTNWDLWMIPASGDTKPRPVFAATEFAEQNGVFSPDGRWIAYDSDEAGRREVFVQGFDPALGKRVISVNGGSHPQWRRDGRELFYLDAKRQLMAVSLETGGSVQTDNPQPLFTVEMADPGAGFAVAGNGELFVMPARIGGADENRGATVVMNWVSIIRSRERAVP